MHCRSCGRRERYLFVHMNQTTLPFPQGEHKSQKPPQRAAMYMRMSTEHQKYSIENQTSAITEYATKHGIEIVTEYIDDGKTGVTIAGRGGLQRLLRDVETGKPDFNMILVLDITRWGRFQDHDENAHYEYRCRRAGVAVEYVGEQFANDGSAASNIIKSVKRVMAGEYSRELSTKVFRGQCNLIEHGFRQGGTAGYGLRRMMLDEQGKRKEIIPRGKRKSYQTDRVILVPGAAEELENVLWMYRAFVEDGMTESQIAAHLNRRGITTDFDREWTRGTVHQVLTNEKYIGNNVYNRQSFKLKVKRIKNTPDAWIRKDGAFEAIVDPSLFYTAQGIIRERNRKFSDDEMITKLKELHEKKGWLSGLIIDEADNMPSSGAYQHRFGSLIRAYQLIGYTPDRDYQYIEINRYLRELHADTVRDTIQRIETMGGAVIVDKETDLLIINGEIKTSIIICRCFQTGAEQYRWKIRLDSGLSPDITIAVRMDANNQQPLDYYLLPALDVENPRIRLHENNGIALDAYRFDELLPFFTMIERVRIPEAA